MQAWIRPNPLVKRLLRVVRRCEFVHGLPHALVHIGCLDHVVKSRPSIQRVAIDHHTGASSTDTHLWGAFVPNGSSVPGQEGSEKESRIKPEHVMPVVGTLITTLGVVIVALITSLATRPSATPVADPAPTVTVYRTVEQTVPAEPEASVQASTGSTSSAAPTAAAPPAGSSPKPVYIQETDWENYSYPNYVTAGAVKVDGKVYKHVLVENACSDSTLNIRIPDGGYTKLTGQVAFPTREDREPGVDMAVSTTDTEPGVNASVPWSQQTIINVPTNGDLAAVDADIPDGSIGLRFQQAGDKCSRRVAWIDLKLS